MVDIPAFKSHFFWLRFVEFWLSMLCFILTMQFNEAELNMFDSKIFYPRNDTSSPVSVVIYDADQSGFNRLNIVSVATCAYTWIILPVILLTYAFDSDFLDKSVLCPMFNFFGFWMFISAGSLMCARSPGDSGVQAAGAFCIITSLVMLGDILFLIFKRYTQLQEPPQA